MEKKKELWVKSIPLKVWRETEAKLGLHLDPHNTDAADGTDDTKEAGRVMPHIVRSH